MSKNPGDFSLSNSTLEEEILRKNKDEDAICEQELSPIFRRSLKKKFQLTPSLSVKEFPKSPEDVSNGEFETPNASCSSANYPRTPVKLFRNDRHRRKNFCRKLEMNNEPCVFSDAFICKEDALVGSPSSTHSHCSSCSSFNLCNRTSLQFSPTKIVAESIPFSQNCNSTIKSSDHNWTDGTSNPIGKFDNQSGSRNSLTSQAENCSKELGSHSRVENVLQESVHVHTLRTSKCTSLDTLVELSVNEAELPIYSPSPEGKLAPIADDLSGISTLSDSLNESRKPSCSHHFLQDKCKKRKKESTKPPMIQINSNHVEEPKMEIFTSTPIDQAFKFDCTSLSPIEEADGTSYLFGPKDSRFFISSEMVHSSDFISQESRNEPLDPSPPSSSLSGSDKENIPPTPNRLKVCIKPPESTIFASKTLINNRFELFEKKGYLSRLRRTKSTFKGLRRGEKVSPISASQPLPSSVGGSAPLVQDDVTSSSQPLLANFLSSPLKKVKIFGGLDAESSADDSSSSFSGFQTEW